MSKGKESSGEIEKLEELYHQFLKSLQDRSKIFISRLDQPNVDVNREVANLRSFIEQRDKIRGYLIGTSAFQDYRERDPEAAQEMDRKMKREILRLKSTMLTAPTAHERPQKSKPIEYDEEFFEPSDIVRKTIEAVMGHFDDDNLHSEELGKKLSGVNRLWGKDKITDDEYYEQLLGVQNESIMALLNMIQREQGILTQDKGLARSFKILREQVIDLDNQSDEARKQLPHKIMELHEKVVQKKIGVLMASIQATLDKSEPGAKSELREEFAEYRKFIKSGDLKIINATKVSLSILNNLTVLQNALQTSSPVVSTEKGARVAAESPQPPVVKSVDKDDRKKQGKIPVQFKGKGVEQGGEGKWQAIASLKRKFGKDDNQTTEPNPAEEDMSKSGTVRLGRHRSPKPSSD